MVVCIVNEPIVRIDEPFCISIAAFVIDVAFIPCALGSVGHHVVIVVKAATTNALSWQDFVQVAIFLHPAGFAGFGLRDVVRRQMPEFVQVECDVVLIGIGLVFVNRDVGWRIGAT